MPGPEGRRGGGQEASLHRESFSLYGGLRAGRRWPWVSFLPSPTAQLWLPSEMIKTKRISGSGIHFSPPWRSLASFPLMQLFLLGELFASLLSSGLEMTPGTHQLTLFSFGGWGGEGTGELGVSGKGGRGRMGGGALILLVKIPRKRKEPKQLSEKEICQMFIFPQDCKTFS